MWYIARTADSSGPSFRLREEPGKPREVGSCRAWHDRMGIGQDSTRKHMTGQDRTGQAEIRYDTTDHAKKSLDVQ